MAQTKEIWKPCPGHDGYEVSNLGNVRTWRCADPPKLRRLQADRRGGYLNVMFIQDNLRTLRKVHQLVLEAFVCFRHSPRHITRHLDGDVTKQPIGESRVGNS